MRSKIAFLCVLWALPTLAGELVGKDRFFIRVTNTRPDAVKILPRINVVPNDEKPFDWKGKTIWVAKEGPQEKPDVPANQWLAPGESTPWTDIGQYMMLKGGRSSDFYLSPVLCGILTSPKSDGLYTLVEVARNRGVGVIRRIEMRRPEIKYEAGHNYPWHLGYGTWNGEPPFVPTVGMLIPTHKEHPLRIYTLEEALAWQLDLIQEFPDCGRLPEKFVFTTAGRDEIKKALGYNGFPSDVAEVNVGDEIQIAVKLPREEQDRRFREYLKSRGFDPLEFIASDQLDRTRAAARDRQWDFVHILPALPDRPKQFYEAANFRYALWSQQLAEQAKKEAARHQADVHAVPPVPPPAESAGKRILAGANFTPAGSCWPDVRQWIAPFRAGQLTMPWTEDWWWQMDEPTFQTYGFLLDALRLAGSYHNAPIQYYIMPFNGQSPDHFRRSHAYALAHGAKIINHFHTEDQTLTTWDYIDFMNAPPMYQAIHDVIRDAGAVEKRLYAAMPQKAQVAILLSRAQDTWDTEDLGGAGNLTDARYNVNNHERKAIWLALRQAQIPVDLITDEDVADGKLEGYHVLYLVGSELLSAAAEPLKKWVSNGGVLYATAGCGLLDEYHRPLDTLKEMYGIADHHLDRKERQVGSPRYLLKTPAVDALRITSSAGPQWPASEHNAAPVTIDALCYRETFQPAGARVIGTYADGSPGAVAHVFGRGQTTCMGVLAGLAYLKPAMIVEPSTLPTAFPEPLLRFIVDPVRKAKVVSPIEAGDPLVETQYMTGPQGDIAVVINWRQQPIDDLVIRLPASVKTVKSLRAAGFFKGALDDQRAGNLRVELVNAHSQVKLHLEISDYLLLN